MQSLVLTQYGLQIADTPKPPVLPGYARIEIRSVGICTTDLLIWKGEVETELPIILGHEISGVIHESSVPDLQLGTLVTSEVDLYCGNCWYCRRKLHHLCLNKEMLGVTTDGGLAEYLSVPVDIIHPLPEGIDSTAGTFVEPLAAAIQTREASPADEDEVVVIIGSGKLGLLISQVYDAYGADVYLVGRNKWQLGLARQLGLRNTINMTESDWLSDIKNVTAGVGPRVVIEATGSTEGITMALQAVRSGGIVSVKSTHGKLIALDPTEIVRREIKIIGSNGGSFSKAIEFLDKGRIEVKRLVSKEFSLEEGSAAFELASQTSTTKVIINV